VLTKIEKLTEQTARAMKGNEGYLADGVSAEYYGRSVKA